MTTLTPIDTQVDLTINKLNEEAFNDLSAQDRLDDNQLYVVTEDQYMVLGQGGGANIRGWETYIHPPEPLPELSARPMTFLSLDGPATVKMLSTSGAPSVSLEYNVDGGDDWNDFIVGSTDVELTDTGHYVQFRAKTTNSTFSNSYNSSYNYWSGTGKLAASGDLRSLYSHNLSDWLELTALAQYGAVRMFSGMTALYDAWDLKMGFTYANTNAFARVMQSCTNLVNGPNITVHSGNSFSMEYWFSNCSSLKTIRLDWTASWSTTFFQQWVSGVPSGGTIWGQSNPGSGVSNFPSGWTVKDYDEWTDSDRQPIEI